MSTEKTPPVGKGMQTPDTVIRPKALLRDLGEIPPVSLDYFESRVLPPLPQGVDVTEIKESLRHARVWSKGSRRWTVFETNPKKSRKSEDNAFKPLSQVFDAVVREARKTIGDRKATLMYASRRTKSPASERSNSTRPDAYLLLREKKSIDDKTDTSNDLHRHSWNDIAVSFEFKKGTGDEDREDDDKKVISSLHHIMRSDPCRRSTLGVTMENTQMRFWFTCRAITLVSKPFDFSTEPEHLIHFFCSVAFANEHQLGWDPTVQRVCVEGKPQYNITVCTDEGKETVYQTTKTISDFSAHAMQGHGTRVFQARLTLQNGQPVHNAEPLVLKDSWREVDRPREDQILVQIFDGLGKKYGTKEVSEARDYFLTVLAAGDVIVDGKKDKTASLLRDADELPPDFGLHRLPADDLPEWKPTRSSEGLTTNFSSVPPSVEKLQIHHRIHYRVVFKEVCQPIHDLKRLDTVFKTLMDIHEALQLLHSIGWVHRALSTGNALHFGGMGKLADLEYAQHMDCSITHEVQTGTLEFMACEVESEEYLFDVDPIGERPLEFMACEVEAQRYLFQPHGGKSLAKTNPAAKCPFRFNPLHDMESLWWIATWTLYYHVDQRGSRPSPEQITQFHDLFPGRLRGRFHVFVDDLDYGVLPASFRDAGYEVEFMHQEIMVAYTESEKSIPPTYTNPLEKLHSDFTHCLASAFAASENIEIFSPNAKRQREDRDTKQPSNEKQETDTSNKKPKRDDSRKT
ncbi:hypothetical protein EDD15DRAFT_2532928 [Pisolithus albus]|nr:hypothetical protein EDD15DRAFT_2532928 [Pisolithus albus]